MQRTGASGMISLPNGSGARLRPLIGITLSSAGMSLEARIVRVGERIATITPPPARARVSVQTPVRGFSRAGAGKKCGDTILRR